MATDTSSIHYPWPPSFPQPCLPHLLIRSHLSPPQPPAEPCRVLCWRLRGGRGEVLLVYPVTSPEEKGLMPSRILHASPIVSGTSPITPLAAQVTL